MFPYVPDPVSRRVPLSREYWAPRSTSMSGMVDTPDLRSRKGSVSLLQLISFAKTAPFSFEPNEPSYHSKARPILFDGYQVGYEALKNAAGGAAAEFTKSVLASATISAATGGTLALPAASLVLLNTARGAAVGASKGLTSATVAQARDIEQKKKDRAAAKDFSSAQDTETEGKWNAHNAAEYVIQSPAIYSTYGGVCDHEGFTRHDSDLYITDWPSCSQLSDASQSSESDFEPAPLSSTEKMRWDYLAIIRFPNGRAAAAYIKDARTKQLHKLLTNQYIMLAIESRLWYDIFWSYCYCCLYSKPIMYLSGIYVQIRYSARCIEGCPLLLPLSG